MPSSVIAAIKYDTGTQVLTVTFLSGMRYRYLNVPEQEYLDFKSSGSKGIYLNRNIKGKYEFIPVKPNG